MPKAVFLDRDGTIIEDRGHLGSPSQAVFFPETFPALRRLQEDFLLFIVTNQSGIAAGEITSQQADRVNRWIVERLAESGIHVAEVYVCPHGRADGCACMKPRTRFLQTAATRYGIDLSQSFTVGDHPHDVEFAQRAGARGVYVLTGHGEKHRAELPPQAEVAQGIGQAAERILANSRPGTKRPPEPLRQAADALRDGGLVAFPTETVYGLGANACDPKAVARIFEVKRRPRFDPLIVHVCGIAQASRLAAKFPDSAMKLARRFWPGPLTLVLPKADIIPDIVTSGLDTVALRMPSHPLALALIAEARVPVAAPSANVFGAVSPTTSAHVRQQLGRDAALVLEGGPCPVGIESTIVSLEDDAPVLLRPGGVPVEQIARVLGGVKRPKADPDRPTAPGQCARHYAPRTPLMLCENARDLPHLPNAGLLTLGPPERAGRFEAVETLSATGDLQEAAANLYAALHRLDAMGLDRIVAAPVPETGLGLAINDRLRRAARETQVAPTPRELV